MTLPPLDRAALRNRVESALATFLVQQRTRLAAIDPALLEVSAAIDDLVLGAGRNAVKNTAAKNTAAKNTAAKNTGDEGAVKNTAVKSAAKRLRPAFAYWGYRGAGGADSDAVVTALAALELVQASALIHDDVIDGSDTRRGEPSTHRRFERRHRDAGWLGAPRQFGESAAILVGDLCLVWSDELFQSAGVEPAALARARAVFDEMRTEVMVGQYLDVLTQATGELSVARASKVATFKSAKYTVERPLLLGAALADAPAAVRDAYSVYGLALGEAFQLRDDILGVFGDPEQTGKPAGDDLREGKRTYLVAAAVEAAGEADARTLRDDLGDPALDLDRIERLRRVISSTGARARTEERIESLAARARAAIGATPIDPDAAAVLTELVEAATRRSR